MLSKTKRTGQNINTDKISRLVASATVSGPGFYKALYKKTGGGDKKAKGPAGDRGSSARMRDGETVGEGADRIGVDNVGHRLLSKMGWAEGGRIGRSEGGLDVPYVFWNLSNRDCLLMSRIMAIVKNTKMGLGA